MRIKKMNWLMEFFLQGYAGITLWPFGIYYKTRLSVSQLTHEKIHWMQQREMPVVFYLWYVIEWFIKLFIYGWSAYYEISFEREAFTNQYYPEYLEDRKPYTWINLI